MFLGKDCYTIATITTSKRIITSMICPLLTLLGFTGKIFPDKLDCTDWVHCHSVTEQASKHRLFGLQCSYAAVSAGIEAQLDDLSRTIEPVVFARACVV